MLYFLHLKKLLMWHELLPLSLAIYLGTVMQRFLESTVKHLVVPAITMVVPIDENIDPIKLSILDKYGFNIKDVIAQTFSLTIALIVCYLFIRSLVDYK